MDALIGKSQFIGLENCTWLYSGAETPPPVGGQKEMEQYMINRGKGPEGRELNAEIERECKARIAEMLSGSPDQIAFLSNSSDVISMIAGSMPFAPGDNVVINTLEFPSGVLPWLRLKERGIEVRVVDHDNWRITTDAVMERVDERTKLVVSSHVSYLTGARLDYRGLYGRLRHTNALFLLDATQSLGAIPVDMNEADFVVCSSYKWLLSIHGIGILAVNPRRTDGFVPLPVGWRGVDNMFSPTRFESFEYFRDARKFETGYPSYSALYTLHFSTRMLLDIGIGAIERHILALGGEMIAGLKAKGYEVMTPDEPEQRAGNISVVCGNGEQLAEELRRRRVYLWGGDGRLRASVHLFNDSADVARYLELLPHARTSELTGGLS